MSKTLQYWGEFRSRKGILWRVELWLPPKEGDPAPLTQLIFPSESPLEIEWSKTSKIDPLQPSSATLNVVSTADREYLDLYAIEAGSVLMKVFREYDSETPEETIEDEEAPEEDETPPEEPTVLKEQPAPDSHLYWSGTLDTELYEEPFSELKNYEVSLVFSDLAILNRFYWEEKNSILSVDEILERCVAATGIAVKTEDGSMIAERKISLRVPFYGANLKHVSLLTDNFFDEDGERMTKKEVLEAVLQPLAMRLIQKNGGFILYDLNAVYKEYETPPAVKWASMDAYLSTDKVYNNVTVKFSPYVALKIIDPVLEVEDTDMNYDVDRVFLSYQNQKVSDNQKDALLGFKFHHKDTGKGVNLLGTDPNNPEGSSVYKFCKFTPYRNKQDDCALLWAYLSGQYSTRHEPDELLWAPNPPDSTLMSLSMPYESQDYLPANERKEIYTPLEKWPIVYQTDPQYIPNCTDGQYLCLKLDIFFDARYNPFEPVSDFNEHGNYDELKEKCNVVYLSAALEILDGDGNVIFHYENTHNIWPGNNKGTPIHGKWVEGPAKETGNFWLSYYNTENHQTNSGIGGWSCNRPAVGPKPDVLSAHYGDFGEGECIQMISNMMGYIRFTLYGGMSCWQSHKLIGSDYIWAKINFADQFRWLCYKVPVLELSSDIEGKKPEQKDFEYKAWINEKAKESLEIDTIVGNDRYWENFFTARGILRDNFAKGIFTFSRNRDDDVLEKLLIDTIYSQYAKRHTILSGTVEILPEFSLLSDLSTLLVKENQSRRYILMSELQNLAEDERQISMVELSEEVWTPKENYQ